MTAEIVAIKVDASRPVTYPDAALWLKAKQNLPKTPQFFFVYFQENQYIMNHRYVEVPTITFLSDFL